MTIFPKRNLFGLFSIIFLLTTPFTISPDSDDLVSELLSIQSQSESGVIHLDDHSVRRFLKGREVPRPYSFLIFFDAVQLHDNSELHLRDLRKEFGILASSYIINNKDTPSANRIFFCDIEFKESQSSFAEFGVNSLPHIRFVGEENKSLKSSDRLDQGDYSRLAETLTVFVESKTGLTVGPIHRPPLFSKKQLGLLLLALAICTPYILKKVISGETLLHDSKLWSAGAVFIYFFSVSGAMHNIIRKMPMFLVDRNDPSRLIFFYQGSGMQLGAEGFAVGSLYTIVGLLLALVTHGLVKMRNVSVQRVVMLSALVVSFWAVRKVILLDKWKTGYEVHGYWPSSW